MPLRRGGVHPMYGVFVGGSKLENTSHLIGSRHYKITGQQRGGKVINSFEQALLTFIVSKETDKFNGHLEKTASASENKMEKEIVIKCLKKENCLHSIIVRRYTYK